MKLGRIIIIICAGTVIGLGLFLAIDTMRNQPPELNFVEVERCSHHTHDVPELREIFESGDLSEFGEICIELYENDPEWYTKLTAS